MSDNILICGDNLEIMKKLYEEHGSFIDLIYIDPPFCSNRNYNTKNKKGFEDKWEDGLTTYIPWLAERIQWMYKLLKDTGSIFIHLDWHSVHYVKVEMDKIFGYNNLINEIIWSYRSGGVSKKKSLARKHDNILWYSKNKSFEINTLYERQYLEKPFMGSKQDKAGRYYVDTIIRDVFEGVVNRVCDDRVIEYSTRPVLNLSKERNGYPTQKPEGLIGLLIEAACKNEAIVADFFSGSGTTIAMAQKLGRQWIGVDQNPQAIELTKDRIKQLTKENIND